jgi:hypothetical protein
VVWEDGAATPLLPDFIAQMRSCAHAADERPQTMNGPSVLDRPGRSVLSVEATNDAIGTPLRVTCESVMRAALMDSGMFSQG